MQLRIPAFLRRPRPRRILRITDDAFVCCSPQVRNTWRLHYLLRGSFGNYLLGGPPFDEEIALVGESLGGVARVLPFETALAEDAARWFTRFGCRWVAPVAAERLSPGPVPVDPLEHTVFAGLRQVDARERDGRYGWRFRWRGTQVAAGLAAAAVEPGWRGLALPDTLAGPTRVLDEAVAHMQAALGNAVPSDWLRRLGGGRSLLCVAVDSLGLVACFDDIVYERNDIEMVGPSQRRQLAALLAGHGFERVSPHCYRHREAVVRIVEPPRTQMSEPLNGLDLDPGAITFVTATQAAFEILLSERPADRRLEEMRRLVTYLPVNLRKVQTALKRRPELLEGHDAERVLARWRGLQAEAVAYYRRRRPDGLHGRLFVPEPGGGEDPTPADADTARQEA